MRKLFYAAFLLIVAISLAVVSLALNTLQRPIPVSEETLYEVPAGASLRRVLNDFERQDWLQHARLHEYWLRYNDMVNIQKGEYLIEPGSTIEAVIEKMIAGDKLLYSVQFIEGKRFSDFLATLASHGKITQTLTGLPLGEAFARIAPDKAHYEGWIFPDTYLFEAGTTDVALLKKAHQRMQSVLDEVWQQKAPDLPIETPYQALILASIIEKETGAGFERPMISGVFSRRLEMGMRLQTDPTVIYGVGDEFDGNLTRKHLRTDTPYNTYTRKGLPPTPIANPGREAIEAAVNPAEGTAIFFVAKGDGTHYFSTTLEEHNEAVREYQRFRRRQNYQSAPSPEAESQ